MKNYTITIEVPVYMTIEVEADNDSDAIDLASEKAGLTGYSGNGASFGKLVGTSEDGVTISAGEPDYDSATIDIVG